jgi:hypothetical protein
VIAAVRGFALGGGCELAMHADIIVAGDSAKFGQPEIRIGIIPGGGGTQRLPRAVGKFKAMKMLLTGDIVTAQEADAMGLVSEVVPDAEVEARALALASQIAQLPPIAARQIKECVLAGQDTSLQAGLMLEAKAIQLSFASFDQKEGMEWQINALSNLGLLSRFIGMLTDSRSFMSFPRHEYFRRTLCNLLGSDIESGLIPNDDALVGSMVKNICYANAKAYLGLTVS